MFDNRLLPRVVFFGKGERDLNVIRTLAAHDHDAYIIPDKSQNEISSSVGGYSAKNNANEKLVVIINTESTDPDMVDDIKDMFRMIIKPDKKTNIFFFVPNVATELRYPDEFKNREDISEEFIEWLKENQESIRLNKNIEEIMDFIRPGECRYQTDKWRNLSDELKNVVPGLVKQCSEIAKMKTAGESDYSVQRLCFNMANTLNDMFGKARLKRLQKKSN